MLDLTHSGRLPIPQCMLSSHHAQHVAAVVFEGSIYTSTVGAIWTERLDEGCDRQAGTSQVVDRILRPIAPSKWRPRLTYRWSLRTPRRQHAVHDGMSSRPGCVRSSIAWRAGTRHTHTLILLNHSPHRC